MPYFKTPAQVADDLGLKEATVRRLARQYKTFTRVGRRVMLSADDVEALIDKIKNPPPPPDWWSANESDPFA
jgi:excisionase family DNA binding protein